MSLSSLWHRGEMTDNLSAGRYFILRTAKLTTEVVDSGEPAARASMLAKVTSLVYILMRGIEKERVCLREIMKTKD